MSLPPATHSFQVNGQTRVLAEEVPIALSYNGETQAVMMASPTDLRDFAYGFSLAEGIIAAPQDLETLNIVSHDTGIELQMTLAAAASRALTERRRTMTGPVGCGLCGVDSLTQALRPLPAIASPPTPMPAPLIAGALQTLRDAQKLHDATHAAHAAGFMTLQHGLVLLREDVGRHNALDKLIGAMARNTRNAADGALLITSRVSVDMVQKAVMAGATTLIAVSAPTALALRTAQNAGLTLIANARDHNADRFTPV